MQFKAAIAGSGSYLPERRVSNQDLEKIVDTSADWIVQRTGIAYRHFAGETETTSMMSVKAAQKALEAASLTPDDIDCIIVATTTPDKTFPSVAVHVQAALGMEHGFGFDVQAVCSGFVYALNVASGLIANGTAKRALVIGADKMSSILNWEDRTTCVLFGDGAGAVVLEAVDNDSERGLISSHLHSDGRYIDLLKTSGGVSSSQTTGHLEMKGREVFKHAVTDLADVVDEVLTHNKIDASEIDWLVPHQANVRIIEATAQKLNMPMEKVVLTIQEHGNTSAASIPLAFDNARRKKDGIKDGQLVLMEAMGGGLTWGAVLVRL